MKRLICLFNHNKRLMKIRDCDKEVIRKGGKRYEVYKCKYCGTEVLKKIVCISNAAENCDDYKDGICLIDNEKCYLKEINEKGLYFDCTKKFY